MSYVVKAYRSYPSTDENGKEVTKQKAVSLGFGNDTQKGGGINVNLDSLPMVTNGAIERISIFPLEAKGDANGEDNS